MADEVVLTSGDEYDSVEHKHTYNLPETLTLLKKFRTVLDDEAQMDVDEGKEYVPRSVLEKLIIFARFSIYFHGTPVSGS